MENIELSNEGTDEHASLGDIKVNHSVVASIVRLAALEVEGVCGVGAGIVDGIADLFSKRESDRGVKVSEDSAGGYSIEIRVVMNFGTELAKTAYQVQMTVRDRLATMTGKPVQRVDVIIEGVRVPREKRDGQETGREGEVWPESPHTD